MVSCGRRFIERLKSVAWHIYLVAWLCLNLICRNPSSGVEMRSDAPKHTLNTSNRDYAADVET
jgi:hypothetical protein